LEIPYYETDVQGQRQRPAAIVGTKAGVSDGSCRPEMSGSAGNPFAA
jgi:hypothetical protein